MKTQQILLSALALMLLACGGSPEGNSASGDGPTRAQKLVITGSSTVAPLISDIARRFEELNPGVRIDVQTGGSSRGLSDVRQDLAHIGMVSRSPKPGEDDLQWFPVANDGLAVIVHAENTIESLEEQQVAAIYRGELKSWSGVGGSDAPITVVSKAEGRSTLEVFLAHFGLEPDQIAASVIIGDNLQGIKTVAGNPDAIGYVSIGTAELEAERGTPIRLLHLGGSLPSTEAVREGAYPIMRTLHVVTAKDSAKESGEATQDAASDALISEFLDFCRSSDVNDLVEGQFFVPIAG